MFDYQQKFIEYALSHQVLRFGQFQLKSGRQSPYFFNTGLFNSGSQLAMLGQFYAQALVKSEIETDVLYGPAYKGIPLACATAIALTQVNNQDIPFAFNRKEAKDHGEGGNLVGSPLSGNILIVDDVITAGTSVRESIEIIKQAGGRPCGVLIALDRQEIGQNQYSAIQEVEQTYSIPVFAIITLHDIIAYLHSERPASLELEAIKQYQLDFGIS